MAGKKKGAGLPLQPPPLLSSSDLTEATDAALRSSIAALDQDVEAGCGS